MQFFQLTELAHKQKNKNSPYLEFLRESSLSMGLYNLPQGGADKQQPHNEDEVYYVISGRASITVGNENRVVTPGSIIFVAAHVPHYFYDIQEDLTLLVFFAPAESSDL